MNILSLESVGKNYGVKPLFDRVTVGLEDTDKIRKSYARSRENSCISAAESTG